MTTGTKGDGTMSTHPTPRRTPAEYLAYERASAGRHEYFEGELFALSGASWRHNVIAARLVALLTARLPGSGCTVVGSGMRLKVDASGLYTYPDVSIVCGPPRLEDEHGDTLLNPTLLAEVLSASTEGYDRRRNAEHYRRLPSLQEYLLVAQDTPHIEQYTRQGEREWLLREHQGLEAAIELTSLGCRVELRDLYPGVEGS
jgi:Uma2 family endonuclease